MRQGEQRSLLVNSGAEAVENAVKIARAATGRPGVIVFGNSFHGRTLLTLAMTGKVDYKRGFGPLPAEVYRVARPVPVPRCDLGRRDLRARARLQARRRPEAPSRA